MSDARTERTHFLGLLAIMEAAHNSQGWAFPYWNVLQTDAALAALASAVRTGAVPLSAPAAAPDVTMETSGGYLAAGQTLEVAQTFVDAYGRETDAGPAATVDMGTGITDPDTACSIGTPSTEASGFEGGLLEVWYSWTDETGGETLPSPPAQLTLPYLAAGLYSQVTVTLPATPASVGAAGANIYGRHRTGVIVTLAAVTDSAETECLLDGTAFNCYRSLPLANSTGSGRQLKITGAAGPADAALTRFYVRVAGQDWTDGDRRVCVGGLDECDPATVVYPLTFTGSEEEMAPGWPPPVSQVFAVRPIDLATETYGELPALLLPPEAVLETELVRSLGEALMSGCEVTAHSPADLGVTVGVGEALLWSGRYVYETSTDLVIPTADVGNPRIDIICIADDGTIEGPTENAALQGTAAAEPTAPTIPVGYIGLAQVAVGAGATEIAGANITDARTLLTTLVDETAARTLHEGDTYAHFTGAEREDRLLTPEEKTDLTDGRETSLHTHPGLGSSGHPNSVSNLINTIIWAEDVAPVIRRNMDVRPQIWRELLAVATMVSEIEAIMARSSRRSFTDADRACAGSTTTDFTIDVIDEGLLVQVDLTISGTSPDIDFSIYRDASRTVLVKTWAGVTATTTFRELLDWLNEETPQDGLAYCSVLNNTANEATVTTTLTIKEV